MKEFWEGFSKYIGIQGIIALILIGTFVAMVLMEKPIPEMFTPFMTLVLGFFFGKNGTSLLATLRGTPPQRRKEDTKWQSTR